MEQSQFFNWRVGTSVVNGARRAAVYDFATGRVYTLNSAGTQVALQIDTGVPLGAMTAGGRRFVDRLCTMGLGELSDEPGPMPTEDCDTTTPSLRFLWLELTDICNLGCAHCYAETQNPVLSPQPEPVSSKWPSLSPGGWRRVIAEAAGVGCREIQFVGGEVLLFRHLLSLIDAARSAGFTFVELFTNGTLLTESVVCALAAREVQMAVSVHGTRAEIHDAVTGLPGSFERTLDGLRRLRDHGVRTRIAGVATRVNQHDVPRIRQLTSELGLEDPCYDVVRPIGTGAHAELVPIAIEALAPKWLTEPNFMADWDIYNHNRKWNPCWAGKLAITSTGDAMPCIMGRFEVVGNVQESSLAEILGNPHLLELWSLTKDQVEACCDCEYRYVCGDCRPLAHGAGGDMHAAYPRCTYDPTVGDWRSLVDEARRPSPVPEGVEPDIALATQPSGPLDDLFSCTPDNRQGRYHRRFECAPDR